ncbi:MAG: helix-turn-helix domain-containing protein, partial [Wenzhouxiangella sp.]
ELDSRNHILLSDEPAWQEFRHAVLEFTGLPMREKEQVDFTTLTRREQQILKVLAQGLSNAGIAEKLYISEKTVRNHLSKIYRKLGVSSRTQTMALIRDRAS